MLPIDVQAEIIRSIQEEKRQRLMEMRQRERTIAGRRSSWRARVLRAGGNVLIAAGRNLQRMAGGPIAVELERRPVTETV
jgi:hypothetical protein